MTTIEQTINGFNNSKLQGSGEINALKDKNMDYIMKINMYLIEKYRDLLFKEIEFKTDNVEIETLMKVMDKIYEIENRKYPLMWYEYGFGSK